MCHNGMQNCRPASAWRPQTDTMGVLQECSISGENRIPGEFPCVPVLAPRLQFQSGAHDLLLVSVGPPSGQMVMPPHRFGGG